MGAFSGLNSWIILLDFPMNNVVNRLVLKVRIRSIINKRILNAVNESCTREINYPD